MSTANGNGHLDRLPPHAAEAEIAVIGAVVIDSKTALPVCLEMFPGGPDTFYDARNRAVYELALQMHTDGQPVDLLTLQQRLRDTNLLAGVGGTEYFDAAQDACHSVSNIPYWADIVQEKFIARRTLALCTEICMKINAGEFDGASGLLDYAEMKILSIRPKRSGNDVGIKQLVQDALEDIENTIKLDGKISGMSTGLYDLDQATDGIHPGEMIVIAAFPSVGKTSLAMNIAENACLELGESVGVFSLEMMSVQLVKRAIMSHARVSLKNLRNGFLAATDFPKLSRAAAKLSIAKIFIDDTAGLSVYEMRARARRMSQEHGVKLFVVDYIQLMNAMGGPRRPENRQQEVALISNGIKEMAKELNAGVLVLSQLNDDGKLKESRAIGADADGLWELTRQDPSDEDRANGTESVTLCAKKQRNGERGKRVPLTFFPSMTRFDCPGRIYASDLEQQNLQAYRQTSPDP